MGYIFRYEEIPDRALEYRILGKYEKEAKEAERGKPRMTFIKQAWRDVS